VGLLAFMLASGVVPQFMTDGTLWWGVGLAAVLRRTNCYRQRFFLGGRTEWGLHWRAGLLQLAKWPYLGLALLEVLFDRHYPYWVTPKMRGARAAAHGGTGPPAHRGAPGAGLDGRGGGGAFAASPPTPGGRRAGARLADSHVDGVVDVSRAVR
jgi:hypothetical protein